MFPASDLRDPTVRKPLSRSRRRPPVKRRPGFRPELETVEHRCLLSGYTVSDMTFPSGYIYSSAAINKLGQVAATGNVSGVLHAVLRNSNGVVTTLDPLGDGHAFDLNNPDVESNVKVVGAEGSGQNLFLWDSSTGIHVTSIRLDYSRDMPVSISSSGNVVVGDYTAGNGRTHAFVWRDLNGNHIYGDINTDPGEFQDLHDLLTTNSSGDSAAKGVIDATSQVPHLQIVANAQQVPGGHFDFDSAFVLTDLNDDGDFLDLNEKSPLASSGTYTFASAINDVGQIVGETGGHAVIWKKQNSVWSITKTLPTFKGLTPYPFAINHGGGVVGYVWNSQTMRERAFLWTGSGGIQDLDSLIPRNSGLNLQEARDINDAGQITGLAWPNSGVVGFLLTPTSAPAATATTSAAILPDANTASLAPVEAVAQSTLVRMVAPHSKPGPQGVLIPLMPVTDQDVALIAIELIRFGTKRPRALLVR